MMITSQSYCFSGIVTLYIFFLVSLVLLTLASSMLHSCRHDQRDALLEFKHEFPVNESNSYRSLSSWNTSIDCCFWEGVMCDAKSGKVISLDLSFTSLNNSLKPNSGLFKLHHLRQLTAMSCHLHGEIPSSLRNLSHLIHLDLSGNDLVGEVLHLVGNLTQLRSLILGYNQFSGNIPVSFANLTKLARFDIQGSQLESTLPPDMSGFHNLEYFGVGGNSLFGPFPTSLFMIPSLTWVDLGRNQFKGPIEFSNSSSSSSNLQYLYLHQNKFDGPIPKSISKFPNLKFLYLNGNNLVGPIPSLNLIKLEFLDLSDNKLEGDIPGWLSNVSELILSRNSFTSFGKSFEISKLTQFKALDISSNSFRGFTSNLFTTDSIYLNNNKLEGEIPSWIGKLGEVVLSHNSFSSFGKSFQVSSRVISMLDLSSNSFRGPLPHWICKITTSSRVAALDLSNNSFSGSIPQCLRSTIVGGLEVLKLQNNNLSGILPPDLFVNDATWLSYLDISGNQLEGKLPESLINCRYLEFLNVESNRFKDKFPSWLGSLPSLKVMFLRSNEFYGPVYDPHVSIGFPSLIIIDISHNDLNGTLPPFYFSSWREMTMLSERVEEYMGDGIIFHLTMEMVNKGVDTIFEKIRNDFRAIDFSGNNFVGEIPKSIGLLKELRLLNLSGNAFTSNIPQSLANLTKLEALDLSRESVVSLSFLSSMNFSHNNLQGPIPQGTQFHRQNCSSFMYNPKLYGLEDICGPTHVPDPKPQETEDLSEPEDQQVISWIAAAIAYGPGVFCGFVIGHIFFTPKHEWFMEKFRRSNPRRSAR
ncbi:hypothetical protein EUTSA_v10024443mg [Eutrema salsugineum]|uniref:Leucine-rich repeat-containing N-terminal plant-type domain-containing protein n=1 Tax=Eutrema salsugineum TaxID=72664 RepID=V4P7L1_EUTSA|nr:hypothetical protein EUTSA_v10024443mg [Eutrema salsugineum]